MPLVDVRVPQMGEGLQEVVIIGFHKKPGDTVKRDEILYSMETDKAAMDVESPYDGVVKEWLTTEGAVLPINTPVARIETDSLVVEPPFTSSKKTGANRRKREQTAHRSCSWIVTSGDRHNYSSTNPRFLQTARYHG